MVTQEISSTSIDSSNHEKLITSLSLAVMLIDDYTGTYPKGNVELFLEGVKTKPVLNKSGYWLFLESKQGSKTDNKKRMLKIISNQYFDTQMKTEDIDKDSALTVRLKPLPSYTFPSNATLIRGMITRPDGKPIEYVTINASEFKSSFRSNKKGEFVIYFENNISKDQENFINHNTVSITLRFSHNVFKEKSISVKVKEGKTTIINNTLEVN